MGVQNFIVDRAEINNSMSFAIREIVNLANMLIQKF